MTIESILKEFYKKHPIKFKNMTKNANTEHKTYRSKEGLMTEILYYDKKYLICSEIINNDTGKHEIKNFFK